MGPSWGCWFCLRLPVTLAINQGRLINWQCRCGRRRDCCLWLIWCHRVRCCSLHRWVWSSCHGFGLSPSGHSLMLLLHGYCSVMCCLTCVCSCRCGLRFWLVVNLVTALRVWMRVRVHVASVCCRAQRLLCYYMFFWCITTKLCISSTTDFVLILRVASILLSLFLTTYARS